MKKTNEINSELSIEEKRKKLIEAIEKQSSPEKKKDILLMPFINEIKLMLDKKMSINSQLKTLNGIGIKISYKTYKNFLDELDLGRGPDNTGFDTRTGAVAKDDKLVLIILNDNGAVKTYAVKDEIKKLGFFWDKDKKGWKKEVNKDELVKIKELKIGYDII